MHAGQDILPFESSMNVSCSGFDDFEVGVVVRVSDSESVAEWDEEYAIPHRPHFVPPLKAEEWAEEVTDSVFTYPQTAQVQPLATPSMGTSSPPDINGWPRKMVILGDDRMNPV